MFCQKCGTWLTARAYAAQTGFHSTEKWTKRTKGLPNLVIRHIPEEYEGQLIEAHEQGSNIIKSFGRTPEPLETALLVEEHRWFWKPKDIKFILIAESHVYTDENENKVKINPNRLPENVPNGIPLNFVKLVYCLGYGEPEILDAPEKIENNAGTKQYFGMFRSLIGFSEKPRHMTRLEWKVSILKNVQEKGIWLLDASCHACAFGKNERLPSDIVGRIVPISWNRYVKSIIDDISIDLQSVWIIGKGLHDILGTKYARCSNWIYQPNVRFKNPEKYEEKRRRELELEKAIRQRCQI